MARSSRGQNWQRNETQYRYWHNQRTSQGALTYQPWSMTANTRKEAYHLTEGGKDTVSGSSSTRPESANMKIWSNQPAELCFYKPEPGAKSDSDLDAQWIADLTDEERKHFHVQRKPGPK